MRRLHSLLYVTLGAERGDLYGKAYPEDLYGEAYFEDLHGEAYSVELHDKACLGDFAVKNILKTGMAVTQRGLAHEDWLRAWLRGMWLHLLGTSRYFF